MTASRQLQSVRSKSMRVSLLGGLLGAVLASTAFAEAPTLQSDLVEVRSELQELGGHLQLAQASGYSGDRIDAFERVVRDLTGRVETMEHRLRQLSDRMDRLESRSDQAPARPDPSAGAYYQPPESETEGAGPRVLGTASESYGQAPPQDQDSPASQPLVQPPAEAEPEPDDRPGESAQASLPSGNAVEQYDAAFGLLRQARWDEAERALEAFIERHPDHQLAGNAKYWLGETHYVRGDYVSAARVFAEGFQQYPDSGKASDNLLKLGMSLGALDRRDDACGTLAELERRYANAPAQILQRSRAERERLGC
ncbi:tol-pal system protein YbgF [Aquibaculum sediminis]|uniref:tol-pal system protein YbgF n=1 Tax=Aquibaculum sediminis TaxID=3231907 RepID=UPI00345556FD